MHALASVVLHNISIDMGDSLPSQLNLTEDPAQHGRRSRKEFRELLMMRNCTMKKDKSHHAEEIRKALLDKFWEEKEGQSSVSPNFSVFTRSSKRAKK